MSNLLAIDASGVTCSAALMREGKITASRFINNGLTHSQTLLCAVEDVMKLSGLTVSELDAIVLTTGPGSFTGVKIGVSTAKGLAFAHNIPCIAVSSLEAVAYGLCCFSGTVCAVMDARRGQLYNALFKAENGSLTRLCPDRQIEKSLLVNALDKNTVITGDAAEMFRDDGFLIAPPFQRFVNAQVLLTLAEKGGGEKINHIRLTPVYLRAPQAERERLERMKEKTK